MIDQSTDYLSLLHNHIDISQVPFSDRGSRLLFFRHSERNAFFIKLAERLIQVDGDAEACLKRPPFIQELVLIGSDGNPLEFHVTSDPFCLQVTTPIGIYKIVFEDDHTIAFGLPSNRVCGLRFRVFPILCRDSGMGEKQPSMRNVICQSSDEVVRNDSVLFDEGYVIEYLVKSKENSTITINILTGDHVDATVQPFSLLLSAAKERWQKWFSKIPHVEPKFARTYAYAWWVMANNLINPKGKITYEAMVPSKTGYVGLWLWDCAFHAIAFRHIDPELARNQIRVMLKHQLSNGMLPDAVFDDGIVTHLDHPIGGTVTKPPILAWSILKLHETDPDVNFISEVYLPLVRWNTWWVNLNDDNRNGLVQYNHPYSSGLDNSPLWDKGMPVESPDLNTYLCIQMKSLATMAEILGLKDDAVKWQKSAENIVNSMIEHFWDPEAGLFWVIKDHIPVKVVTPFNLYPLWTGLLPEKICRTLMKKIVDPEHFWGKYPIPTVSKSDPLHNPQDMWRGPVWANINYFLIEALLITGEKKVANLLREATLDLVMTQTDVYEYYDAETGAPPPKAVHTFGWTAAIFIDLAIQASRDCNSQRIVHEIS